MHCGRYIIVHKLEWEVDWTTWLARDLKYVLQSRIHAAWHLEHARNFLTSAVL